MQVLVVIIDDNKGTQTFQLERERETRNYVVFSSGDKSKPLISRTYVAKGFKTEKKS